MAGTLVCVNSLPLSTECKDAVATLAGLRQPLALATVSVDRHRYEQTDAIHPSSFSAQPSVVPIESVPTGSRVGAINPQSWDYDDTFPEPDPYSWSRIDLVVSKDDGTIVDVELLRPDQWILDHDLFVGAELPIEVTELKVHGVAVVTAFHACPPIAAGEGEVVVVRMCHPHLVC